jgi:hypothetical protein
MIKYSKDGFEISHLRYLSDASVGLMFFFMFIVVVHTGVLKLPFFSDLMSGYGDVTKNAAGNFEKNSVKITEITVSNLADFLLIFLLFLLHPAIGIIISVLSWFFLEALSVWFVERILWKYKIVAKMGGVELAYLSAMNKFNVDYYHWHGFLFEAEIYLRSREVGLDVVDLRRSLRLMLRNVSFLILLLLIIFIFQKLFVFALLSFIIFVCTFIVSGAVSNLSSITLFVMYYRYYMYEVEGQTIA